MGKYEASSIDALIESAPNDVIQSAFIKAYAKIHGYDYDGERRLLYKNIIVAVSGGSDSDIMMDMIERIGYPEGVVKYVFYDTGVEFDATKRHLDELESKYGVIIQREKAKIPVPLGVKRYGVPFISKRVSEYIHRLQINNFKFEDKPFNELYEEYPHCKTALKWWCNEYGENSQMNISRNKLLKEFLVANPPTIKISHQCCDGAKKKSSHMIKTKYKPDLYCLGIRKAEGGIRAVGYKNCFDSVVGDCDNLRPIFWFTKRDKELYAKHYDVTYSDAYHKYGLTRTGCVGCPFGKDFEFELKTTEQHEPKLCKAAIGIFNESYEYTRQYREYVKLCISYKQHIAHENLISR